MFANRDIPVTKMAIVIGIDYRGSSVALGGCEVDATRMNAFFQRAGYATTLLTAIFCCHAVSLRSPIQLSRRSRRPDGPSQRIPAVHGAAQ